MFFIEFMVNWDIIRSPRQDLIPRPPFWDSPVQFNKSSHESTTDYFLLVLTTKIFLYNKFFLLLVNVLEKLITLLLMLLC